MEQETVDHKILIIQCDCSHVHSNLIACARHKIIDEIVVPQTSTKAGDINKKATVKSASRKTDYSTVHVVFILQLPRKAGGTNFVGFQGGDWLSVYLDDLRPLKENEISFQNAIECSISEIFYSMYQSVTSPASEKKLKCVPSEGKKVEPSASSGKSMPLDVARNKFQPVSFNANQRLRDLIQMACSWLYDTEQNRERTTKRISILTDLIPTESTKG